MPNNFKYVQSTKYAKLNVRSNGLIVSAWLDKVSNMITVISRALKERAPFSGAQGGARSF